MSLYFELGPIRPPSEATSLLLRITRNCTWNKCGFCTSYKDQSFSRRSVEEIKKDIDTVAKMSQQLREFSQKNGMNGDIGREMMENIYNSQHYELLHVASWLYYGGQSVFLQDANSIVLKTTDLLEILNYLKKQLPWVKRVTSYGRSDTILRKSIEDLVSLRQAGLSRIHVGMESGCNDVLKFIDKGVTAEQHIEAGKRVKESGISLSEYVILGLGGKRWAAEHPLDTARVLNAIDPDFIRLRTLTVIEGSPLHQKKLLGEFEEQSEVDVAQGERLLIQNLDGINSNVVSDHFRNLLQDVKGKLPFAKPAMLEVIDSFLSLPERKKQHFILGRRWGVYHRIDDMKDPVLFSQVEQALEALEKEGRLAETIASLKGKRM
ncbi:MAG: radical SAM protein [Bacillota bacterium]|jgi:radical SAM superfamily enzyme YgiQ (UPF0313 family)